MQCSQCGSSNPAEAVRCEECGAKLASQRQQADLEDQDHPGRQAQNRGTPSDAVKRSPRRRPPDDLDNDDDDEYKRRPRRRRPEDLDDDDEEDYERRDDAVVSTLIPYKNPMALISYYLGIFSLIPVLGFLLAPVALILGILGLSYRRTYPEAKGTAHAWVGIVLSSLSLLGHLGVVALVVILSLKK
jgi:hypothetical protein